MSTAHRLLAGLAAGALAMLALFLGTGTAAAADYGHVSGWPHPGYVSNRVASSPACPNDGPRFTVTNYRIRWGGDDSAKADAGPKGSGKVCVTRAAFDAHPDGAWFNNTAGTRASEPVG